MSKLKLDPGFLPWLGIILITLALIVLQDHLKWLTNYPKDLVIPFDRWLNSGMGFLMCFFGWFFRGVSWLLEWPIDGVRIVLQSLPWAVISFLICMFAFIAAGWRLSLFALISCLYMVIIGYWSESMNTLSLVAISVPLAVLIGFGFCVWAFQSQAAKRIIMPMLDILQTVPAFAYLLLILMLFGFGTVVGSLLVSYIPSHRWREM